MATNNQRVQVRETLIAELRRRLSGWRGADLAALFEKHGLPFAPIARPEELLDDPHLNATGGLADIILPDGEKAGQTVKTALFPLMMDGKRLGIRSQPPTMGEHTDQLMREAGYGDDEIARLRGRGAVA
jgi:crotonobetainyl-CoA:carnitine CoA-transferase CaiB-like acyl-CoA transferase